MLSTSCDRLHPDDESYLLHQESTPALVLSPKHPHALASHRAWKPSPAMLDDYPTSVEGGNSPRSHAVLHNNNALRQEKQRRRKLSRLYTEQATMNEQLREENESMQAQQRALVRLLQEKDKMIGDGISGGKGCQARQASVERFLRRHHNEIEDPDEITEKHLILRRLILKKKKDLVAAFAHWRANVNQLALDD
jgi:hypothetical protein